MQAILELREDGTLDNLAAHFLESSTCESISEAESGQLNMALEDVAGVFIMLAICIALSFCSWSLKNWKILGYRREMPSEAVLWNSLANMPQNQRTTFLMDAIQRKLRQTREVIQN